MQNYKDREEPKLTNIQKISLYFLEKGKTRTEAFILQQISFALIEIVNK